MFTTFQTIINAGGYDLTDLTERIKTMYAMGELTEDEMEQLIEQAQTNAKTGEHDAYHVGDKITYNGKHYTCIYDGCVWTPDAYPQGWKE